VSYDKSATTVLNALAESGGNRLSAANILGISNRTIFRKINSLRKKGIQIPEVSKNQKVVQIKTKMTPIVMPVLPNGAIDINELIARRKTAFERKDAFQQSRRLITVKVKDSKPIGVLLFGDPHVDDDGCNLAALERDMNVIKRTEGLYAACIGDLQNNWVGRLSRLWAHQETTAHQAWQLVEWFVNELRGHWLFMVQGNHDHWSGSGDPLRWIQRQAGVDLTGDHMVRLALKFSNSQEVRIAARHDWPGHSMWNPSHGQLRAANMTHHDHIIVSGHRHTGGYQMLRIPSSGMLAHLVQLGSYKIHDEYADALGLPSKLISPSTTAIINPVGNELQLVRIEHDAEAAADYLTWMRQRAE